MKLRLPARELPRELAAAGAAALVVLLGAYWLLHKPTAAPTAPPAIAVETPWQLYSWPAKVSW